MPTSRHPCQARHLSSEAFFHNWRYCCRPANTHHRRFTASPRTRTRRDVSASVPRFGLWRLGRRIQKSSQSTEQLQEKLSSRAMPDVGLGALLCLLHQTIYSILLSSNISVPCSDPSVVFGFPTSRLTICKNNLSPWEIAMLQETRHRATWA
jgi:hypothetical protein